MNIEKQLRYYYSSLKIPESEKICLDNYKNNIRKKIYIRIISISTIVIALIIFVVSFLIYGITPEYKAKEVDDKDDTIIPLIISDSSASDAKDSGKNSDSIIKMKSDLSQVRNADKEQPQMAEAPLEPIDEYFLYFIGDKPSVIIRGSYVSSWEYNSISKEYYVYNIEVNDILNGNINDENVITIIAEKRDDYRINTDYNASIEEKYESATIGYFDQINYGDDVLVVLAESPVKEETLGLCFYQILTEVFYVDADDNIVSLLVPDPEILDRFGGEGSDIRKYWKKIGLTVKELRDFIINQNKEH